MAKTSLPGPAAPQQGRLHLSALIKRKITARKSDPVGRLSDVVVRLRANDYPLVTGVVAAAEGRKIFLSTGQFVALDREELRLGRTRIDMSWFERREGEILLRADLLGRKVTDIQTAQTVRAADLELAQQDGEWVLVGVLIRRKKRWKPGPADAQPEAGAEPGGPERPTFRDWSMIDPRLSPG
jgi:hypothetical protein